MTTTTTTHRAQFIKGLRQFADFLDTHPDYPATREHHVLASDDEQGAIELKRLAAILGADVRPPDEHSRHWQASRKFAGLWVTICYVTRASLADYDENVQAERRA